MTALRSLLLVEDRDADARASRPAWAWLDLHPQEPGEQGEAVVT